MKRIAIVGYQGKMGSVVFEQLKNKYELIGIGKNDLIKIASESDLIIDFSNGTNSTKTALWCAENKIPLIIGATGQTAEELKLIKDASTKIPIMKAGNFSLGIAIVCKLLKFLKEFDFDNICIFEKHHKNKKDYPSGTAIELKNLINKNFDISASISGFRGGEEIGTHEINLYFGSELLTLSHQAFSRSAFAKGVEMAVNYILNNVDVKQYSFEEIL